MLRTLRTLPMAGLLAASLIGSVRAQNEAPEPANGSESAQHAPDVGDEVVVRGQRMSDI